MSVRASFRVSSLASLQRAGKCCAINEYICQPAIPEGLSLSLCVSQAHLTTQPEHLGLVSRPETTTIRDNHRSGSSRAHSHTRHGEVLRFLDRCSVSHVGTTSRSSQPPYRGVGDVAVMLLVCRQQTFRGCLPGATRHPRLVNRQGEIKQIEQIVCNKQIK